MPGPSFSLVASTTPQVHLRGDHRARAPGGWLIIDGGQPGSSGADVWLTADELRLLGEAVLRLADAGGLQSGQDDKDDQETKKPPSPEGTPSPEA